jgi:hypothetical protein
MFVTITEILLWSDGPLLVHGTDDNGEPIIAYAVERTITGAIKALAARVTPATLQGVLEDAITLRRAFTEYRIGPALTGLIAEIGHKMELTELPGDPPDKWLPVANWGLKTNPYAHKMLPGVWRSRPNNLLDEIAAEYQQAEEWYPRDEKLHTVGQLPLAAAAYAYKASNTFERREPPALFPWSREWWKPQNRRRDLIRAAVLIIAEIERLDRSGSDISLHIRRLKEPTPAGENFEAYALDVGGNRYEIGKFSTFREASAACQDYRKQHKPF